MTTEGVTLGIIIGAAIVMLIMNTGADYKPERQRNDSRAMSDSTSICATFAVKDSMFMFDKPVDITR